MVQEDKIRNTPVWQSLNEIWKFCSQEQRAMLSDDFEVVASFIRKHTYIRSDDADEYRYLNGISSEAKQFVISLVDKGERNIYHSIMSVLMNKPNMTLEALEEYYFDKFGERRPYLSENAPLVREVIALCWKKKNYKRKRRRV